MTEQDDETGGQRAESLHFSVLFCFVLFCFAHAPWLVEGGSLIFSPGIEPSPLAVNVQSLNHWATREFPLCAFVSFFDQGGRSSWNNCLILRPSMSSLLNNLPFLP